MTLANLDQALKLILAEVSEGWPTMIDGSSHDYYTEDQALEAMRRAYRLAESKEEMSIYLSPEKRAELQRDKNQIYRQMLDALDPPPPKR